MQMPTYEAWLWLLVLSSSRAQGERDNFLEATCVRRFVNELLFREQISHIPLAGGHRRGHVQWAECYYAHVAANASVAAIAESNVAASSSATSSVTSQSSAPSLRQHAAQRAATAHPVICVVNRRHLRCVRLRRIRF